MQKGKWEIRNWGGDQLRREVVDDMLEIKSGIYNSRLGQGSENVTKKRKLGIERKGTAKMSAHAPFQF